MKEGVSRETPSILFEVILQLTTCSIYISTSGVSQRCLSSRLIEAMEPFFYCFLIGRKERRTFNGVYRKKIDMAEQLFRVFNKCIKVFIRVIETFDKEIFESNATVGFIYILFQVFDEFIKRLVYNARHYSIAISLDGTMKRDSKCVLIGERCKAINSIQYAAS